MSRYLTLHAGRGAAAPNRVTILWVCAILDDDGLWNHRRGITGRETSVTVRRPADHRGRKRTGEGMVARGFAVQPITCSLYLGAHGRPHHGAE